MPRPRLPEEALAAAAAAQRLSQEEDQAEDLEGAASASSPLGGGGEKRRQAGPEEEAPEITEVFLKRPAALAGGMCEQQSAMSEVAQVLLRQQGTLDGIMEMQRDLQRIVQEHCREMERHIDKRLGVMGGRCRTASEEVVPVEEDRESTSNPAEGTPDAGHMSSTGSVDPSISMAGMMTPVKKKSFAVKASLQRQKSLQADSCFMRRMMKNPWFDTVMGGVIVLNFAVMFVELEWRAFFLENRLGISDTDQGWSSVEGYFEGAEKMFNCIYLVELLVQLFVFRLEVFHRGWLHNADMMAIILSSADSFVLDPIYHNKSTRAVSVMRLIKVLRALRLLRFTRVLRLMSTFHSLRVLVRAVSNCVGSLFWSMGVMAFFIGAAALLVSQLTRGFIEDSDNDLGDRVDFYHLYGSATNAAYTMFEATFSGVWSAQLSRNLIYKVSPSFRIFFIVYIVSINFALTKIVGALFLKETMDVAAIDAERMAIAKSKEQRRLMEALRKVLAIAMGDNAKSSGDCGLRREQLEEVLEREEVVLLLEELQIEPPELLMLYNLLSEDGSTLNRDEFLIAALKLKTSISPVDMVQIRHEQLVIKRCIACVLDGVHQVDKALHPHHPWKPALHLHPAHHNDSPTTPTLSA